MTIIRSIEFATSPRETVAEDRSAPGRFVVAVSFESAATATQNSDRPETGAFAVEFAALCSDGQVFREFDVVDTYGGSCRVTQRLGSTRVMWTQRRCLRAAGTRRPSPVCFENRITNKQP